MHMTLVFPLLYVSSYSRIMLVLSFLPCPSASSRAHSGKKTHRSSRLRRTNPRFPAKRICPLPTVPDLPWGRQFGHFLWKKRGGPQVRGASLRSGRGPLDSSDTVARIRESLSPNAMSPTMKVAYATDELNDLQVHNILSNKTSRSGFKRSLVVMVRKETRRTYWRT
jgi:hypothetical protein